MQRCARLGGVWDDSDTSPTNIGGRCLNSWQASKRLKDGRGGVEEVVVSLSHDPNLAGEISASTCLISPTLLGGGGSRQHGPRRQSGQVLLSAHPNLQTLQAMLQASRLASRWCTCWRQSLGGPALAKFRSLTMANLEGGAALAPLPAEKKLVQGGRSHRCACIPQASRMAVRWARAQCGACGSGTRRGSGTS